MVNPVDVSEMKRSNTEEVYARIRSHSQHGKNKPTSKDYSDDDSGGEDREE